MKKVLLSLLVAMVFPVLASATDYNHAITPAVYTSLFDRYSTNVGVVAASGLSAVDASTLDGQQHSATFGIWFRPTAYYGVTQNNPNHKVSVLFYYGTSQHNNLNAYNVQLQENGKLNFAGWGFSNMGVAGEVDKVVTLDEWHYLAFSLDAAAGRMLVYLDNEVVADRQGTAGKGLEYWTSEPFHAMLVGGWGYVGAIDEFHVYNRALTAEEIAIAKDAPKTVSNLTCFFDFQEVMEGTVGSFENKAGYEATANIPAKYYKINGQASSDGGHTSIHTSSSLNNYTESAPDLTTITEETARMNIDVTREVTVNVPASVEHATVVVTADDVELAAGEHTLNAGATMCVTATADEGYRLDAVKVNGNEITNGGNFLLTEDITSITVDVTELASIVYYTLTIEQPAEGGTVAVASAEGNLTTGAQVEEGTELTVTATAAPGYELVAVKKDGASLASPYHFTMTANATVTAEFQVRETFDYCTPAGTSAGTPYGGRGVTSLTIRDNAGNQASASSLNVASGGAIYIDKTDIVLTSRAGSEITVSANGSGSWMHEYFYIDYNRDGVFTPLTSTSGVQEGSELVTYNHLGGKNSKGETTSNDLAITCELPAFTLPATLAPGTYRMRFKLDWDSDDPCGCQLASNKINYNNGRVIDFTLRIESSARDITIAVDDAERGSVAFEGHEGTELTDYEGPVTVVATAAEGYAFVEWTNQAGTVLSTDATYTYGGADDVTLTANFGYTVKYTSTGDGTTMVSVGTATLTAGEVTAARIGSAVAINCEPAAGKVATVTVNGSEVTLVSNTFTFTLDENTEIAVSYAVPAYTLTISVHGNGVATVYSDADFDTKELIEPSFSSGDLLNAEWPVLYLLPGAGEVIEEIVVNSEVADLDPEAGELAEFDEGSYIYFLPQTTRNLIISVTFSDYFSGIDAVATDANNGAVEYYNLQGVRVNSNNITTGLYIRRQNGKAAKVFVK